MNSKRVEILPILITGIAAGAGGLSVLICALASEPLPEARLQNPRRASDALRWPLALAEPVSPAAVASLLEEGPDIGRYTVRVSDPAPTNEIELTPRPWLLSLRTVPVRGRGYPGESGSRTSPTSVSEMRVLLPQPSRFSGGRVAPFVVSETRRRDWKIAGVDGLQASRNLGHALAGGTWSKALASGANQTRVLTNAAFDVVRRALNERRTPVVAPIAFAVSPSLELEALQRFGRSVADGSWRQALADGANRLVTLAAEAALRLSELRHASRISTPDAAEFTTRITASSKPGRIAEYLRQETRTGAFPIAAALGKQLDHVADDPAMAAWAWAVAYRLRTLSRAGVNAYEADRALAALEAAIDEAIAASQRKPDSANATELRRAAWAIQRRVDAWRPERSSVRVAIRQRTERLLRDARWAMRPDQSLGTAAGLTLWDPSSRLRFPGAVGSLRVARRLEDYESRPDAQLAALLAEDALRLASSDSAQDRELARAIDQNYRNANLRVAIASGLIESFLPEVEPVAEPIRGRVAGAPVRGQSTTTSKLAVRLSPDPNAWRIGLEANGVVRSQTFSHGGPAVMGSRGATSFVAKKLVVLTPDGVRCAPAVSEARVARNRLVSIATDYDRVPLVSDFVRSSARREYQRLQPRARAETQRRVERRVSDELDQQVGDTLAKLDQRYREQLVARLERLDLRLEPIEMRTTPQRVIGRMRLANGRQLAAHTPRMRAPSDSLFSLQLHESTVNNALAGLELAGETVTPTELRQRLESRLGVPPTDAAPERGVVMRFADADPVRVRLQEGRAQLTFAVDAISVGGRRHREFKVHAFFRPAVEGLTAELVQEGSPSIEGRLRTASRLHLHGVFGKVLGEGRRVPLLRLSDRTPDRVSTALIGLATNQLVIEDGWLGIAIGPERPPERVALQVGGYVR